MFNKLRAKLKIKAEQKVATVIVKHVQKQLMKSNNSWKTTLAGWLTGLPVVIGALLTAYNNGAFTNQTGSTLLMGIAAVVIGTLSKDSDKTGLPVQETPTTSSTKTGI